MDINRFTLSNGTPLKENRIFRPVMEWMEPYVAPLTEDEFWPWIVKLHEKGPDEALKSSFDSIQKAYKDDPKFDFDTRMLLAFDQIFQNNVEELDKRGIKVYHK